MFLVRRQGSVESAEKRRPPSLNPVEQNLKRKVKSAMISVYGKLCLNINVCSCVLKQQKFFLLIFTLVSAISGSSSSTRCPF